MKNILLVGILGLIFVLSVTGCSVGMAVSGKKEPNLSVCQVGADRGTVELQLGSPRAITTLEGGKTCCEYEYETGNEPSAGRAVFHGAMDVITLGLWEVVGSPVEGFQGEKRRVFITYDGYNKVIAVNTAIIEKTAEPKSDEEVNPAAEGR